MDSQSEGGRRKEIEMLSVRRAGKGVCSQGGYYYPMGICPRASLTVGSLAGGFIGAARLRWSESF